MMKKKYKIPLTKAPNLAKPGLKFDHSSNKSVRFFSKINNSLKLLEEPRTFKNQPASLNKIHNIRYSRLNERMKKLAQPREDSSKFSIQEFRNQTPSYQPKTKSQKLRPRVTQLSTTFELGPKEISGTKLAPMPWHQILKLKEKMQLKKTKQYFASALNDDESDDEIEAYKHQPSKLKGNDGSIWAELVQKEEGRYDLYDKQIMEKTKQYIRKQYKMNHQSLWK